MVTLKGNEVHLAGNFLKPGNTAPDFTLVDKELQTVTLSTFKDKMKFIAVVVSLDTSVCLIELKKINELAKSNPDAVFLIISKDLPFRQKQICLDEKIENIIVLSDFRPNSTFGQSYGLLISDSPLAGLLARAILILDKQNKVLYSELVPEITHEPNLDVPLKYFKKP